MKPVLTAVIAGLFAVTAVAASAQTATTSDNSGAQQQAPGAGGTSKPGVSGLPGGKSGPAVTPSGSGSSSGPATTSTRQRDQSNVPGQPGDKSGATDPNKDSHPEGTGNHPGE